MRTGVVDIYENAHPFVSMCVCACVYVWVGVGERVKVRGFVSLSILLSVCVGWSALL